METMVEENGRKVMKASYARDNCVRCGKPIHLGDEIELVNLKWNGPQGPKQQRGLWVHTGCDPQDGVRKLAKSEEISINKAFGLSDEKPDASELAQQLEAMKADIASRLASHLGDETRQALAEIEVKVLAEATKVQKRVVEVVSEHGTVELPEATLPAMFDDLLFLAKIRANILMVGPAGCGKTHTAHLLADALQLPFAMVSCTAGMSESQLTGRQLPTAQTVKEVAERVEEFRKLGFGDEMAASLASSFGGDFRFSMTRLVELVEHGGVFLFDEGDAADSNVMLVVNALLANGSLPLPNRTENPVAKRHPDFICILAANTFGRGADRMYVGRNQLDESTLDRFRIGVVEVDYDENVERSICGLPPVEAKRSSPTEGRKGTAKELYSMLTKWRERIIANKLRRIMSTRFVKDAMKALDAGASLDWITNQFFSGWPADEMNKVRG